MRRLTVISVAFPFAVVNADPVGGAEQVLARLDQALIAAGHRSIVISADGSRPAGELIAIPQPKGAIDQSEWERTHVLLRRIIADSVRRNSADVIHMHGTDFHLYLPPPGPPVLATLHMPFSYYDRQALEPERSRTWINGVSRFQHRGYATLRRLVGPIENGVSPPSIRTGPKRPYALAMGRICPEKGFHFALDAAKSADVPLLLAGQVFSYPEHERYFAREISTRLDRWRRWIGPVTGARKWRLLASARCLLIPSLIEETASLVAREALAVGTPVIAFPNGALADTVEPGRTGFLVRTSQEMAGAIRRTGEIDPQTCRMAAQERFSADRMTAEYLRLYDRIVQDA